MFIVWLRVLSFATAARGCLGLMGTWDRNGRRGRTPAGIGSAHCTRPHDLWPRKGLCPELCRTAAVCAQEALFPTGTGIGDVSGQGGRQSNRITKFGRWARRSGNNRLPPTRYSVKGQQGPRRVVPINLNRKGERGEDPQFPPYGDYFSLALIFPISAFTASSPPLL